jgi:hypothetical protein
MNQGYYLLSCAHKYKTEIALPYAFMTEPACCMQPAGHMIAPPSYSLYSLTPHSSVPAQVLRVCLVAVKTVALLTPPVLHHGGE